MAVSELESQSGSLSRGLAILDYLAVVKEATVNEIAEAGGLSRSATYRLVERLSTTGYVASFSAGRWRLGPSAAQLAMAAVHSADVAQVAPELLRLLVQQARETVGLSVFNTDTMVFIYRERGPHHVTVNADLGARRPLHSTSVGKAFLAALPRAEARALIRGLRLEAYTPNTITSLTRLEADLDVTRKRGWSMESREFDEEIVCCGSAILDHSGRPIAAISAAGLASRMAPRLQQLGPLVSSTAEAISRKLGYNPEAMQHNTLG